MEQHPSTSSTLGIRTHASDSLHGVPSAYIEAYLTPGGTKVGPDGKTKKPQKRWRVRARVIVKYVREDGQIVTKSKLTHLGSRAKKADAVVLHEWAEERLKHGFMPRREDFWQVADPTTVLTVTQAVNRYLDQRPDLSEGTLRTYRSLTPHIARALGARDVKSIQPDDVRELIRACVAADMGADATRSIRGVLVGALDYAGVAPNPARDRTVKLPSRSSRRMDVPPAEHVKKILQALPAELVLPVAMLEATGARISELIAVEHPDIDYATSRMRLVGKGDKPRLVPVPTELLRLLPTVPATARAGAGRLWPGLTADRIRKAMMAACDAQKIPRYSPHKLRHRFASRHVLLGTPITQISAWLGHAKTSMTHDVYAKVLDDGDTAEAWRSVIH